MEASKHLFERKWRKRYWCSEYRFYKQSGRMSTNIRQSNVGIDGSQLYPFLMCQPMPLCLRTRYDLDPETSRFTPQQNQAPSFEKKVMSHFQTKRPD